MSKPGMKVLQVHCSTPFRRPQERDVGGRWIENRNSVKHEVHAFIRFSFKDEKKRTEIHKGQSRQDPNSSI